jgi:hypothetical protein
VRGTKLARVRRFGHGERRREAREEVAVVLAIGHTLRAHEALGCPDALPGFLEVVHRLIKDGVFVGYIDEYGEEREASYACRRCTDSR